MSETELVCLDISGLAFHASRGHPNLPYSSPNQHTYSGTFTDLAISKPLESLLVVRPPGSSVSICHYVAAFQTYHGYSRYQGRPKAGPFPGLWWC